MERLSRNAGMGFDGFWMRRGYERLGGGGGRRKRWIRRQPRPDQLDLPPPSTGSNRKRRFWRIRLIPRLKLRLRFSPKKFFAGLRDAYVRTMVRIADSSAMRGGAFGFQAGYGVGGFGARPLKEYDDKMMVEIYKSIVMAPGQMVPAVTPPELLSRLSALR